MIKSDKDAKIKAIAYSKIIVEIILWVYFDYINKSAEKFSFFES